MRTLPPILASLLLLSSCGSPPKPPTVDESTKRPANSAMAIDLQSCRSELQNVRIHASESERIADSAAAALARATARQQAAPPQSCTSASAVTGNMVFSLRFSFASTRVVVPSGAASVLIENARVAPLVMLRGRTDGMTDSSAESRVARERASAVRDYLVGAGINPSRIRTTYQPSGDFAADNSTAAGRGMNRRVEIEVYRALPVAMAWAGLAP